MSRLSGPRGAISACAVVGVAVQAGVRAAAGKEAPPHACRECPHSPLFYPFPASSHISTQTPCPELLE